MLTDQIADAVVAARSSTVLDKVARVVWRALERGHVSDDDAQRLAEAVQARRVALRASAPSRPRQAPAASQRPVQRSPDRQRSIERRRRLAASGPVPPAMAMHFTVGQLSVLRIVADEVRARGHCWRCMDEIAARAGVSRRTAQSAIRAAAALGLVTVEESRRSAWMSNPNRVCIVSREWRTWLRLAGARVQNAADHGQRYISTSVKRPLMAPSDPSEGALKGRMDAWRRQDDPAGHARHGRPMY